MSQQARKEQEGVVVRRLTAGVGAAALGLAWYFTSSAVSAAPIVFGAAPPAGAGQPIIGIEQLDDHVFVRTVHVPALSAPAGGVRGTAARPATAAAQMAAATGQATAAGPTPAGTAPAPAATSVPIAQPMPAPATPAPAPAPTPVATTGGSTPAK